MRIHWLWLATRPGLSDRKKMAILKAFPDPEDVYLADEKELSVISGLTEEEQRKYAYPIAFAAALQQKIRLEHPDSTDAAFAIVRSD